MEPENVSVPVELIERAIDIANLAKDFLLQEAEANQPFVDNGNLRAIYWDNVLKLNCVETNDMIEDLESLLPKDDNSAEN